MSKLRGQGLNVGYLLPTRLGKGLRYLDRHMNHESITKKEKSGRYRTKLSYACGKNNHTGCTALKCECDCGHPCK